MPNAQPSDLLLHALRIICKGHQSAESVAHLDGHHLPGLGEERRHVGSKFEEMVVDVLAEFSWGVLLQDALPAVSDDTESRPDLLERLVQGSLQEVPHPQPGLRLLLQHFISQGMLEDPHHDGLHQRHLRAFHALPMMQRSEICDLYVDISWGMDVIDYAGEHIHKLRPLHHSVCESEQGLQLLDIPHRLVDRQTQVGIRDLPEQLSPRGDDEVGVEFPFVQVDFRSLILFHMNMLPPYTTRAVHPSSLTQVRPLQC
mmetsp:Transcript_2484/g.5932  ORF Transcript_2484/g.5932 Transcript_2484/m.5932 type:complete len:257 (-) Transcript_2484:1240-2010(-)